MEFTRSTHGDLINYRIPTFNLSDRVAEVRSFFEDGHYSHAAVYGSGRLLGNISAYALYPLSDTDTLQQAYDELQLFWVAENAHWLEAFDKMLKAGADLIPVVGTDGSHRGYYLLEDIEGLFGESLFVAEPGEVVVISGAPSSFSLSQIVQIIELNGGHIYGLITTLSSELSKEVAVKVSSENFTQMLSELRRYDYQIAYAPASDLYFEQLKERSDYLTNFLNL